ncbi:hypothetical protein BLA29_007120 [Euroglyphus maynei]|uniref:Uncharacterized protein n=1 Tax=Euroglyphus maynei TaxID=6958 RepID=A0A1Y3B0P8_EURMA|nr:hypothetical protein BLA29_007120 [Euroglyphus maynei]
MDNDIVQMDGKNFHQYNNNNNNEEAFVLENKIEQFCVKKWRLSSIVPYEQLEHLIDIVVNSLQSNTFEMDTNTCLFQNQ